MQTKYTLSFRAVNHYRETESTISFYLASAADADNIIKEYAKDFMNFAHAETGAVTVEARKYDDDGVTLISIHEVTHNISRDYKEDTVILKYRSSHGKVIL